MPSGENTGSHIKIGSERHTGRTVGIIVAVLVAGAAIGIFYWRSSVNDAPKLQALSDFREAYAKKCPGAKDFEGPTSSYVAGSYLRTPTIQEAVATQAAALATSSCDDVLKALKLASYPVNAN
ncbi:MAG: hypothetical protein ABI321_09795 [Polyangia bacterium]